MSLTLALMVVSTGSVAVLGAVLVEPWLAPAFAAAGIGSRPIVYVLLSLAGTVVLLGAAYRYTRSEVFAETDAAPVDPEAYPDLHDRVSRLAGFADMPAPAVALSVSSVPNSYAVGGLARGTIVVSEGLLETLDGDELEAVLAHELAHLKNRDALVMTLASFVPALAADSYSPFETASDGTRTVAGIALVIVAYLLSMSVLEAPPFSLQSVLQFVIAAGLSILVGGILLGVLAAVVTFVARSLSRQREFLADRASAELTGDPAALASALTTLTGVHDRPVEDARTRYRGVTGLCLLPYGFESSAESADETGTDPVEIRSHPPTHERIERLRALAAHQNSR